MTFKPPEMKEGARQHQCAPWHTQYSTPSGYLHTSGCKGIIEALVCVLHGKPDIDLQVPVDMQGGSPGAARQGGGRRETWELQGVTDRGQETVAATQG